MNILVWQIKINAYLGFGYNYIRPKFILQCAIRVNSSEEWNALTDKDRKKVGLKFEDEGEFWYVWPNLFTDT